MARATKELVDARTNDILRIMLDGAEAWDLREYVREKEQEEGSPWHLADGAKPLSYGQIRRYAVRAEKLIRETCRISHKRLLRKHQAQRRNLYAKAVSQGDIRAAASVLKDLAELQGLYPALRRGEHSGEVRTRLVEEIVIVKPGDDPRDTEEDEATSNPT
jgi:hypothetical protein